MEYELTIDNLTITANPLHNDVFSFLNHSINQEWSITMQHWRRPTDIMYQDNFKFNDGSFFQIGKNSQVLVCRLEFNPNKCNWQMINEFISRMKNPKITRIDWAYDLFNVDMSKYIYQPINPRKTIDYYARSGKLETKYLGSPKSGNFARIYDKAKEKIKSDDPEEEKETKELHWRLEAVQKSFGKDEEREMLTITKDGEIKRQKMKVKDEDIWINPFEFLIWEEKENIEMESLELNDLKIQEKAMIYYLNQNPNAWNELSYNSKKKYETIYYGRMMNLFNYEYQPFNIWEKEKDKLIQEINSWLQPAQRNSINIKADNNNNIENIKKQNIEKAEKRQLVEDHIYNLYWQEDMKKHMDKNL